MAFTVTFPTQSPPATPVQLAEWLLQEGESHEVEGTDVIALNALPVHFRLPQDAPLSAWIDIDTEVPLMRLVDLLFAISVRVGADVRLTGVGEMTRSTLWMRLADEQDRLRIAAALKEAEQRGQREEVAQRLWTVLATLKKGADLRWDAHAERIVEMIEVGAAGGISQEEACWLADNAAVGDLVPKPVQGYLHLVAIRWLRDAYPGLTDSNG